MIVWFPRSNEYEVRCDVCLLTKRYSGSYESCVGMAKKDGFFDVDGRDPKFGKPGKKQMCFNKCYQEFKDSRT